MLSSVGSRLLEHDGYCLDLRDVPLEGSTSEYIIFLNVKRAFFSNFHVLSDLSLESLALHIFQHLRHRVAHVDINLAGAHFVDYIEHDERDRDAMHINLHPWLRVVVARKIRKHESYHQRITGYMDFENRLDPPNAALATNYNGTRSILDSHYEKAIFETLV